MIGKDGLVYAEHCRHCGMSINSHAGSQLRAKCLWTPLSFSAIACSQCRHPIMYQDDDIKLDLTLVNLSDNDYLCGRCNPRMNA